MEKMKSIRFDKFLLGVFCVLILSIGILAAVFILQPTNDEIVARGVENYGWLRVDEFSVAATGTPGAVSAEEDSNGPVRGHIQAVHLDYASTISTTTDLTLTQISPPLTILQLTDYYTDTWFYPVAQRTGSTGSTVSDYDRLLATGQLSVTVGETISGTIVTVTVYWGE